MEQKPQEKITESFKGEELIEETSKATPKVEAASKKAGSTEKKAPKKTESTEKKAPKKAESTEKKSEPVHIKKELKSEQKPKVSAVKQNQESLFDKMSTWQAVAGILAALLLLSVFTSGFIVASSTSESISMNEAESLAINYVNSNLLQAPFTAELESSSDEGDLYRLTITVAGQSVDSYMTKDGRIFFPQGFDTSEVIETVEAEPIMLNIEGQPMLGDENAPVTIIEFSDFECPFCKRGYDTMKEIIVEYVDTGKAKLVFMDFPLSFHQNAKPAAIAAACAEEQGMFWEFHDLLFENQDSLNRDTYLAHAETLNLDVESFTTCIDEERYSEDVDADMAMGQSAGVTGTPAFIINGELFSGALPYETLAEAIESNLDSGDSEMSESEPEFAATGEEVSIELSAKKWLFTPKELSVNEGDIVSLTIQPDGLEFEFAIPELDVSEQVSGETTVTFTADTAGEYTFECASCEDWRGMTGTLTVE